MSASDFAHLRRNNQRAAHVEPRLWRAKVTKAPASTSQKAIVAAINTEDGGTLSLGEASWPKPAGKELPAVGDMCLIALDETGQPWIIAWNIPHWGD